MGELTVLTNKILFSKEPMSYKEMLELKAAVMEAKKTASEEELKRYYENRAGNILGQGLVVAAYLEKNR